MIRKEVKAKLKKLKYSGRGARIEGIGKQILKI